MNFTNHHIYVIVRPDISPGRKSAQVAHAVAGLVGDQMRNPMLQQEIIDAVYSGYLIVLEGYTHNAIGFEARYRFHEPDFGMLNTATAYLVHEANRECFREWPLAYGKKKWWKRERFNYY